VRPSARAVALQVIHRVTDEGGYSTLVVPSALARSGLDGRDRAFATELAFGTLRSMLSLDWAIERRANRPVARMSPGARAVLRMGAYQLLVARVPPHAAVGETVGLASPRERGFANAVLRKLASDPPTWPAGDREADVAVRTGLQPWAVRELGTLLPSDQVEEAAVSFATRGRLCLRANTPVASADAVRAAIGSAGHQAEPAGLDPSCMLVDGGDPSSFPGFDDGDFAVQDQASAFVVRALDTQPGQRVLDACAAPGGKTAYVAALVGDTGEVVAADLHPSRVSLIRASAQRLHVHPMLLAQDATAPALGSGFDRIMVDAPCSGIGSARRRPELLWRPRREELSRLARTQVSMVSALADLLTPGGRLVYSVCTFPRAETDAACDAIVRHRPDLEPVQMQGPDGRSARIRLWPHRHESDGMFIAAFSKRA